MTEKDNTFGGEFVERKLKEAGRGDLVLKYIENGKRVEPALDVIANKIRRTRDVVELALKRGNVDWSLESLLSVLLMGRLYRFQRIRNGRSRSIGRVVATLYGHR